MTPRTGLAILVVVLAAGCTGGGGLAFDAVPATVDGDALEATGYEGGPPERHTVTETVDVAGQEVDVSATTWTAAYVDPDRRTSLVVVSTPDDDVGGQSVNPLARLSDRELVERTLGELDERYGEVEDVRERDAERRSILGQEVEVATYAATVETDRGDVPVRVHLATVSHDGDVVVAVGVNPEAVDERATLLELMESIER